jgi:hypothetical protein
MATTPLRPGIDPELDNDTKANLNDRLKTIERDAKESEEWTPELKARLIGELKHPLPR